MKKNLILVMFLLLCSFVTTAQPQITVQNNNTVTFFNNLDSAIVNAQNGDTIYLPGGSYAISIPIDKKLHFFGIGHKADSCLNNLPTTITGNVFILPGADSGSLNGISFMNFMNFGDGLSTGAIEDYTIKRCRIFAIQSYNQVNDLMFVENMVTFFLRLQFGGTNNVFSNNIIYGDISNIGNSSMFCNNILIGSSFLISSTWNGINYSVFQNNIFYGPDFVWSNNNSFNNNLFAHNLFISQINNVTFPWGTNIGSNNIHNQSDTSIFVNHSGFIYDPNSDYRLKASSPGVGAGTDSTDVGIYGGLFPWKDSSMPEIPRIEYKNISNTTDQNGNLQINIKVSAQDN